MSEQGDDLKRQGTIIRALSGFYYVRSEEETIVCRAKGRFRKDGLTPLVGDRVEVEAEPDGTGTVSAILPRRNAFGRPAIANVDYLVMIISGAIPVTDPFIADRVTVRCEKNNCGAILVINKTDLNPGDELNEIYSMTSYPVVRVSAATGEGIEDLRRLLQGKICCFTGNSGVGKSSILNALDVSFSIPTAEVSQKLGRGRHTTRHVELFDLGNSTYIADTPGFASFNDEDEDPVRVHELAELFPEFREYHGKCRFDDCKHRKEPSCAVRQAVDTGAIHPSRYASYLRLYDEAAQLKEWEIR